MPNELPPRDEYLPRIVDDQVRRYLEIFGAVEVAGTKWCGKTWTACRHGESVSYVDDALALAQSDPQAMLAGEQPHVIDEWQLAPAIWNTVRHAVDRKRGLRGAWLLTGSSTPLAKDEDQARAMHSGAGRIGRIRMHPMSLAESGDSTGQVSLAALFRGEFARATVPGDAASLAAAACRGGWPETLDLFPSQSLLTAREYLNLLFSESVPRHGRDGGLARRIALSLARNLGQAATYKTLLADVSGGDEPLTTTATVASYLELLKNMYVIEEVPGWVPARRSPKRLSVKPKRYLADPSLAVALLGMNEEALLADWQTFGLVFENMCVRDLMVYAQALPDAPAVPVRYYRDDAGLEADAIVELPDGRWAAFEFKLGIAKADAGVATLKRVREKVTRNPHARTRPPEFVAVLTGTGEYAYQAEEGIYVIPLRALGA
ncbi:ATP-binding protein [Adlercreutzia rubneri]